MAHGTPGLAAFLSTDSAEWKTALAIFAPGVYQKASAAALNAVAKQVDASQRENLRKAFTLRNRYTEGSLKVFSANEKKDISSQNAVAGSFSPYLPLHDSGGLHSRPSGAVALPTLSARGNSPARVVKKAYRLDSMSGTFIRRTKAGTQGLFLRTGKKLVMVRRLVHSIRIKKTEWHSAAVRKWGRQDVLEKVFRKKAEKLLDSLH